VVVCRGQYCNIGRRADKILKRLEPMVDAVNGDKYPKPVLAVKPEEHRRP